MNTDHQEPLPLPPTTTTTEFHRHQPPSPASNHPLTFPKPLPQTPSPTSETNSTPESRLAAAIGRAFFNIPPSPFPDSTATNPLFRTFSDADSSANQTLTTNTNTNTTPPKVPRTNNPLRRTLSDSITSGYEPPEQQQKAANKNPLRRTLSDSSEYQLPQKTPRVSSSPQSSTGKQSPQSQVIMKKVEDMVREIEQRCWEIMREEENVAEEVNHQETQEQEECVGVERLKNGDLRFELSCSCGKRFEMLIKNNGYCFYRLT